MTWRLPSAGLVIRALALVLLVAAAPAVAGSAADSGPTDGPLTLVVMDPLAAPLSCPCVQGYAQRDYAQLAKFLQQKLGRPVEAVFSTSLVKVLRGNAARRADLVIGKESVVRSDAKQAGRELTAIARLTGKDGATTQTGLVVVPAADPARTPGDLKGYRIFFGPLECDEKHAAALALLAQHDVPPPARPETSTACSDGALRVLELGPDVRAAAVISSYAKPLLEGCGTIERGSLRVVAETEPVPFITALVDTRLTAETRKRLTSALLEVGAQAALCTALETLAGFVPLAAAAAPAPAGIRVKKK